MASILEMILGGQTPNQTPIDFNRAQGILNSPMGPPDSAMMPQPPQSQSGVMNQPGILERMGFATDNFGGRLANALMSAGSPDPAGTLANLQKNDAELRSARRPKMVQIPGTPFFMTTTPDGRQQIVDSQGNPITPGADGSDPLKQYMMESEKRKNDFGIQKILTSAEAGVTASAKKDANKEQVKTAGDSTQTGLAVTELTDIANSLDKTDSATGPYVGLLPKMVRDVVTPEGAALQDRAERIIQASLRATLGAQFTEKEGKGFLERAYNPRQSEAENASRLRMIATELSSIQNNKEAALAYMKEKGTLNGFVEALKTSPAAPAASGSSLPSSAVPGLSPGASKYFQ